MKPTVKLMNEEDAELLRSLIVTAVHSAVEAAVKPLWPSAAINRVTERTIVVRIDGARRASGARTHLPGGRDSGGRDSIFEITVRRSGAGA